MPDRRTVAVGYNPSPKYKIDELSGSISLAFVALQEVNRECSSVKRRTRTRTRKRTEEDGYIERAAATGVAPGAVRWNDQRSRRPGALT